MTKEELYLKTIFCCIACDGDIATEEVDMVKDLCAKDNIFHDVDSEKYLNSWITEIKSILSNRCDTIWDIYADKRFARPKSLVPNRCNTIWDIYAGERITLTKSLVSNR